MTSADEPKKPTEEELRAIAAREAALRLARLGGSDPHAKAGRRRRPA